MNGSGDADLPIESWLDFLPLPLLFAFTFLFVVLAIRIGSWLARTAPDSSAGRESIGSVVGATLGLLAFLLAFTFNMAAGRYDERKKLFLDDVNAIGTTYLRAGLLAEPYQTEFRDLLRRYVDVRVTAIADTEKLPAAIAESGEIHDRLWSGAEKMLNERPPVITDSLYITSLNEMIDIHESRVAVGLLYRIPATIWIGLYAVAGLGMVVVGFQFGQSFGRTFLVNVLLATAFSAVILLIADLDRAAEGTVMVGQEPLLNLQQRLDAQP